MWRTTWHRWTRFSQQPSSASLKRKNFRVGLLFIWFSHKAKLQAMKFYNNLGQPNSRESKSMAQCYVRGANGCTPLLMPTGLANPCYGTSAAPAPCSHHVSSLFPALSEAEVGGVWRGVQWSAPKQPVRLPCPRGGAGWGGRMEARHLWWN